MTRLRIVSDGRIRYDTWVSPLKLILFGSGAASVIYLVDCLIAKKWKRIHVPLMAVYFFTVALIGLFGEIFLDTVYNAVVGHPLWYYNILPIHCGYTSSYAIVTWGLYGFHLYLLHETLAARWSIIKAKHLALIFSIEALILEALLTLSARAVFGKYLYYYVPGDLWHVTSFQNIPFYFICGMVVLKTLRRFRADPRFFSIMSAFLLLVLVFMAR